MTLRPLSTRLVMVQEDMRRREASFFAAYMSASLAVLVVAISKVVPVANGPTLCVHRSPSTQLQRHGCFHVSAILLVELPTFWLAFAWWPMTAFWVPGFWSRSRNWLLGSC